MGNLTKIVEMEKGFTDEIVHPRTLWPLKSGNLMMVAKREEGSPFGVYNSEC